MAAGAARARPDRVCGADRRSSDPHRRRGRARAASYQFEAAAPDKAISDAPFFGQHGFWPDLVDLGRNINMRATFLAAGPGIKSGEVVPNVAMVDIAPTLAALLGIPAPARSQGRVIREMLVNP